MMLTLLVLFAIYLVLARLTLRSGSCKRPG